MIHIENHFQNTPFAQLAKLHGGYQRTGINVKLEKCIRKHVITSV